MAIVAVALVMGVLLGVFVLAPRHRKSGTRFFLLLFAMNSVNDFGILVFVPISLFGFFCIHSVCGESSVQVKR